MSMYHYSDRVITDTVVANIKRLIDEQDEGIPTRAARRCNMNQRTLDRFYKGERQPTLELVEQVARGYGLQAWQLLVPNLDASNPPVISAQTVEERELYARLKSAFDAVQAVKN